MSDFKGSLWAAVCLSTCKHQADVHVRQMRQPLMTSLCPTSTTCGTALAGGCQTTTALASCSGQASFDMTLERHCGGCLQGPSRVQEAEGPANGAASAGSAEGGGASSGETQQRARGWPKRAAAPAAGAAKPAVSGRKRGRPAAARRAARSAAAQEVNLHQMHLSRAAAACTADSSVYLCRAFACAVHCMHRW